MFKIPAWIFGCIVFTLPSKSAEELVNALSNQNNKSINGFDDKINLQTTETKLNSLYQDWVAYKEGIEKKFTTKQNIIKKQGGHNATKWK